MDEEKEKYYQELRTRLLLHTTLKHKQVDVQFNNGLICARLFVSNYILRL